MRVRKVWDWPRDRRDGAVKSRPACGGTSREAVERCKVKSSWRKEVRRTADGEKWESSNDDLPDAGNLEAT